MNMAYSSNFGASNPLSSSKSSTNTSKKVVELMMINTLYKKLVSNLVSKMSWLRNPDNTCVYTDVRNLMNYVKLNHGSVFRRVVLSAMLDSTKKLEKKQHKVESPHTR